mmetsp:Transcript_31503/g.62944  ORF Transcript_31503/g.62944 Transcript_31503/m.62944 type:complete len:260 (-) Transcript_31503:733-1512(-)
MMDGRKLPRWPRRRVLGLNSLLHNLGGRRRGLLRLRVGQPIALYLLSHGNAPLLVFLLALSTLCARLLLWFWWPWAWPAGTSWRSRRPCSARPPTARRALCRTSTCASGGLRAPLARRSRTCAARSCARAARGRRSPSAATFSAFVGSKSWLADDGVGKLSNDGLWVKKLLNAGLDERHVQDVMHAWAHGRILAQQPSDEISRLTTVIVGQLGWRVVADAHDERRHRVCSERRLQRTQLVQDAAERPHIGLLTVLLALA